MYLLDTNVISELRKAYAGKADANVVAWADSVYAHDLFISVMSIQEIEIGVQRIERRDATQGRVLRRWLEERVLAAFADRILPVDLTVARAAAELHVPNPRPVHDALIAATGRIHHLTIVTRNTADFEATGVQLINPWHAMAR